MAARLDGPAAVDPRVERRAWLEHMRVAASDRLIEQPEEIAAYLAAGFNTIVLYDTEDGLLKSEDRIAFETAFAREHELHILLGKATEPYDSAMGRIRTTALRARHPLAVPAAARVSDDEIRERLALWDRYAHDLIVGVFFLHDDAFLIHVTAARQRYLYQLAHETVPDWAVFGMIGEMGFDASADDVALYFDPAAFDHLIVLMYPLNIGELTGEGLDNVASTDPDDDMRRYIQRYLTRMREKFMARLNGGQRVILVIQAFAYDGEPSGHVPRSADIMIEATLGGQMVRSTPGQERNGALAYFLWDGARSGMSGLWQRPDWIETAEAANRIDELMMQGVGLNP